MLEEGQHRGVCCLSFNSDESEMFCCLHWWKWQWPSGWQCMMSGVMARAQERGGKRELYAPSRCLPTSSMKFATGMLIVSEGEGASTVASDGGSAASSDITGRDDDAVAEGYLHCPPQSALTLSTRNRSPHANASDDHLAFPFVSAVCYTLRPLGWQLKGCRAPREL